jgi:DNA processing protein
VGALNLVEVRALLLLRGLPGVGDRRMEVLLDRFGSGVAALEASDEAFQREASSEAAKARRDPEMARLTDEALARCRELSIAVIHRGSDLYPDRLLNLHAPPAVLFVRGDPGLLSGPAVAIVGSRRSTAYGRRVAGEVARALVPAGVTVVSGLALGIDAAAHRATVEANGATVAVLGSGPDVPHPPSNRDLFQRIVRDGLIVSEHLPGAPPLASHFPRRNRILAALSDGVVVVEAARRSGALITADLALDLGREIMAVPGSIYSPSSEGTNRLIRLGAHPILEPQDVLRVLGLDQPAPARAPHPRLEPDEDAARIWDALDRTPRSVDELAKTSDLSVARTLASLSTLEVGGWVRKEAGMRFAREGA